MNFFDLFGRLGICYLFVGNTKGNRYRIYEFIRNIFAALACGHYHL